MHIEQEKISPKDEFITILLALVFGGSGIYKFYLGKWIQGIIMLICSTSIYWGTTLFLFTKLSINSWFLMQFLSYGWVYIVILFDIFKIYTESMTDGKCRLLCSKATKEENGIFPDKYGKILRITWTCVITLCALAFLSFAIFL